MRMCAASRVDRAAHRKERVHHPRVIGELGLVPRFPEALRVRDAVVAQRIELADDDQCRRQARKILANERRIAEVVAVGGTRAIVVVEPQDRLAGEEVPLRERMMGRNSSSAAVRG